MGRWRREYFAQPAPHSSMYLVRSQFANERWNEWTGPQALAGESCWSLPASAVTQDGSQRLSSIDPLAVNSFIFNRCMASYGFGVIRNFSLDTAQHQTEFVCGTLMRVLQRRFVIHPQGQKGLLCTSISADGSPPQALPPHTDASHILCLFCIEEGVGGSSMLSSAILLHRMLQEEFPNELAHLRRSWRFHRGTRPGAPFFQWPIFRDCPNFGLSAFFLPNTLRDTPRLCGFEYSQEEISALNIFTEIAIKNSCLIPLKRGDMLFLNNKKVLHGREQYSEPKLSPPRTYLRLWLNLLPSELADTSSAY